MERQLDQLRALQQEHNGCPIICAGDIFDKWNSPPELINFAIQHLPKMYSIPGQHDLPNHSYDNIKRSAYWTLVEAEVIEDLKPESCVGMDVEFSLSIYPFPWGFDLKPLNHEKVGVHLAVVHDYVWVNDKKYPGAPEEKRASNRWSSLLGYDAAVFGDNHKGFLCNQLFNCGTFMRRKIDEISYKPMVGLLMHDGSIRRHYLDCSEDKFIDVGEIANLADHALDATDFLRELAGLGKSIVDFAEAVKQFCKRHKVSEAVESIILEAMEGK